jgi:hypothetical protein
MKISDATNPLQRIHYSTVLSVLSLLLLLAIYPDETPKITGLSHFTKVSRVTLELLSEQILVHIILAGTPVQHNCKLTPDDMK